jgi:hypothetical protein
LKTTFGSHQGNTYRACINENQIQRESTSSRTQRDCYLFIFYFFLTVSYN